MRAVAALETRTVEVTRVALLALLLLDLLLHLLLAHLELSGAVGLLLPRLEAAAAEAFGADLLTRLAALFARLLALFTDFLALFAGLAVLGAIVAVAMVAAILREGRRSRGAGKKDGDKEFTHVSTFSSSLTAEMRLAR